MDAHATPPAVPPSATRAWRTSVVGFLQDKGLTRRDARARALRLERALRRLSARLHNAYGSPHLGNWRDPTDEFVLIALSRKTAEQAYLRAYSALKDAGDWEHLAMTAPGRIARLIRGCGLEQKKARAIKNGLGRIRRRFGRCDLGRAAFMDDATLFEFLSGLPEFGPKSARCVLLYSFGRPEFPVDAHVGRVLARLGTFTDLSINLATMHHKQRQAILAGLVPPDLRFGLHVNLVAHGRRVCRATAPLCPGCPVRSLCAAGRRTKRAARTLRGGDTPGRPR